MDTIFIIKHYPEDSGTFVFIGAFNSQVDAEDCVKHMESMHPRGYTCIEKLDLYDNYKEWVSDRIKRVKENTLKRLNKEERKALGLE